MARPRPRSRALSAILALALCLVLGCRSGSGSATGLDGIAAAWLRAWNAGERAALAGLFDEDAIFWWSTMPAPTRGKQEIDRYFKDLWGGWADIAMHANTVFTDPAAGKVAIDWVLTARDRKSGRPIRLAGVDVLQVRGGLITADRGIFNSCNLLAQLRGLPSPMPAPGAREIGPRKLMPGLPAVPTP